MSLVGDQLSGFARDMERDSKAQRLECGAAVNAVAARGGAFIDDTLQLGNTQVRPAHALSLWAQAGAQHCGLQVLQGVCQGSVTCAHDERQSERQPHHGPGFPPGCRP